MADLSNLGTTHFTSVMSAGVPSWTVLALEAPLDRVVAQFVRHEPADVIHRDVPQVASRPGDRVGEMVPAVRVSASRWTVILRSIHSVSSRDFQDIQKECRAMSSDLEVRALYFIGEKTLFYCGYELFESGRSIERAGWEINAEKCQDFMSTRRKLPKRKIYDLSFADATFREIGIYIPVCHGKKTRQGMRLGVIKASAGTIEKAHLLELKNW